MQFVVLLLLGAPYLASVKSQDLSCVLADSNNGNEAVWSIGLDPLSGITAKYFGTNPTYDLCYANGNIYTAGPSSELAGASTSHGGHIARIAMTGAPQIIAQFASPCTAIGCDEAANLLVFAIQGVGIKSSDYGANNIDDHAYIAGSFIRNIFVDSPTTTCYFVDMSPTSFNNVYAVDYSLSSSSMPTPIGSAGTGAVGCVLDHFSGSPHLSILYDDCELERCPISGPLTGCGNAPLQVSSGSCLAISSTADSIFIHDDINNLLEIDIVGQTIFATTSSPSNVTGMDCFFSSPGGGPCDPNPCLNGGTCTDVLVSGYICDCVDGYTGVNCEIPVDDDMDDCDPNPCEHGGTCLDLVGTYECECLFGLEGQNCEDGSPELLALLENLRQFGVFLGNKQTFTNTTGFYADDAIIEFLEYPQFRGQQGHAQLVDLEKALFTKKETSNLEIRQICDLCFEVRFAAKEFPVDPNEPFRFSRAMKIWCFDFESLAWKIKTLAVTPDPQD